jgi:hypothetical protein
MSQRNDNRHLISARILGASIAALFAATQVVANSEAIPANEQEATSFEASPSKAVNVHEWLGNVLGNTLDGLNLDEAHALAADRIPGFAGLRAMPDGSTGVQFARGTGLESAMRASDAKRRGDLKRGGDMYASMLDAVGKNTKVSVVSFDARQLLDWKRIAITASDAIMWVDIDHQTNRLHLGIDKDIAPEKFAAVEKILNRLGIPFEAMNSEPAEMMQPVQAVGGGIRTTPPPLRGGSQISWVDTSEGGSFVCSVSAPATRNGVAGFITASHCGNDTYQLTGTTFGSPNANSNNVGAESVDPTGFSCTLGSGFGACRNSDAAFVTSSSTTFGSLWVISPTSLQTTRVRTFNGSTDYQSAGTVVNKSGRTTGTTSGSVTRDCVDTRVGGSPNYVVLCANFTNARVDGGDSGGTWYAVSGASTATYYGVTSFKDGSGNGGYSPFGQIKRDLGSLRIF